MPESHAAEPTTPRRAPPVTPEQILRWAREHHARAGDWPSTRTPGVIPGTAGERWQNLDQALRCGGRGLPGGSSLARLLEAECGVRNRNRPPPLAVDQVLAWADQHHGRTGRWPAATSGLIPGAGGETWGVVAAALETGVRGLPGGSSLARLLAGERLLRQVNRTLKSRTRDCIDTAAPPGMSRRGRQGRSEFDIGGE